MSTELRWTSADLELLPDDGKRYEIIDGELHMSKQPHWHHQQVCTRLVMVLGAWSEQTGLGVVNLAPGIIFDDDDDVAPDVVWISKTQLAAALAEDGKLHAAPELVIEVLSPGLKNEQRDREAKVKLYSRRGVREYWIVDWRSHRIEVYRRAPVALYLEATLLAEDTIVSPLLPGFAAPLRTIFQDVR